MEAGRERLTDRGRVDRGGGREREAETEEELTEVEAGRERLRQRES